MKIYNRQIHTERANLLRIMLSRLMTCVGIFAVIGFLCPFSAKAQSGVLPVMHIDTDGGVEITSKEEYIGASYWIEPNGHDVAEGFGTQESPLRTEIKGRGNFTWTLDKKPYKLKLEDKLPLFGMPKNKHWALMRYNESNTIGLLMGDFIGMAWTAHQYPLEVVLNGSYIGLYELAETNRIGSNRVDIWEQPNENEDPETVSGGWLVEIDNYTDPCQITVEEPTGPMWVTYHSPDVLSELQEEWLKGSMQALCDAVYDSDKAHSKWEDMLDVESIARYFIVSEVMDYQDAFDGSFYLHRDLGEGCKWVAGPLWDISCMQRYKTDYTFRMEGTYAFKTHLIKGLINDPEFCDAVKTVWEEFYPTKAKEWLAKATEWFNFPEALECDYERWEIESRPSQQDRIAWLCRVLNRNLEWFDNHLPSPESGIEDVVIEPSTADDVICDVLGRKVNNNYRGFCIKNGKKYISR